MVKKEKTETQCNCDTRAGYNLSSVKTDGGFQAGERPSLAGLP